MKPKILKTINFVDSAARQEFKIIPEFKPPQEGVPNEVKQIFNKLLQGYIYSGVKYEPLTMLYQGSRGCIQYYSSDPREKRDICSSVANQIENELGLHHTIQKGRAIGGEFYRVKFLEITNVYIEIKTAGAGENRLYIGSSSDPMSKEIFEIIEEYSYNGVVIKKIDLSTYLRDSLIEFKSPSQNYYSPNELFSVYIDLVSEMSSLQEVNRGSLVQLCDNQNRLWLRDPKNLDERSRSPFEMHNVLKLINKFCLPNISVLELLLDEQQGQIICRPRFLPKENSSEKKLSRAFVESMVYKKRNQLDALPIEALEQEIEILDEESCTSRDPEEQRRFREELIDEIGECIISSVRSTAVLEAAHLKPWSICCREGDKTNMFVKENGVLLRSDLHKLYDRGLISFKVNENRIFLQISSSLDQRDRLKLGIVDGLEARLVNPKSRLKFFDYHHQFIFQE
jgi:hypothetical protein